MALTNIQAVSLLIGNLEDRNPFYPIFTDEEIQYFLDVNGNNVNKAARMAAQAAAGYIACLNVREVYGDVEFWNDAAKQYGNFLNAFIKDQKTTIPSGLMPYAAGISKEDISKYKSDPDVVLVSVVSSSEFPDEPFKQYDIPIAGVNSVWE